MPENIAYYAPFVASDESSFVTGTVLRLDGGATNTFSSAASDSR